MCVHKIFLQKIHENPTERHYLVATPKQKKTPRPSFRVTKPPFWVAWKWGFPTHRSLSESSPTIKKLQAKYSFCLRSAYFGFTSTSSSLSSSWKMFTDCVWSTLVFPGHLPTWVFASCPLNLRPLVQLLQLLAGPETSRLVGWQCPLLR